MRWRGGQERRRQGTVVRRQVAARRGLRGAAPLRVRRAGAARLPRLPAPPVPLAALQPSHFGEPTEAELAGIIAQIKAENVPAIFASEVFPNGVTDEIADGAGVQVVRTIRDDVLPGSVNASQHTYVGMMLANARTIVTALGGDATSLEEIDASNTFVI